MPPPAILLLLLVVAHAAPPPPLDVCNSLNGPFCPPLGIPGAFAPHMRPIPVPYVDVSAPTVAASSPSSSCRFDRFPASWMDAGGVANDIMEQRVATADDCEALCCAHPQCHSYSFWASAMCYLRASTNAPRPHGDAFSGIRRVDPST